MEYSTYGRHCAVDTWGSTFDVLNNGELLEGLLVNTATKCGATVLSVQAQQFEPIGVTVLVLLAESHLSIHTYPEKGFAALDCYTCGETIDPKAIIEMVCEVLNPVRIYHKNLVRGIGEITISD